MICHPSWVVDFLIAPKISPLRHRHQRVRTFRHFPKYPALFRHCHKIYITKSRLLRDMGSVLQLRLRALIISAAAMHDHDPYAFDHVREICAARRRRRKLSPFCVHDCMYLWCPPQAEKNSPVCTLHQRFRRFKNSLLLGVISPLGKWAVKFRLLPDYATD